MKRTLLLLMLLPLFCFSQTDLVRWRGFIPNGPYNESISNQPTYLVTTPTNFTAGDAAGYNINYSLEWAGFQGSNWPTGTTVDLSKYFEFTITPANGYKINLSEFNFEYYTDGIRKMDVKYLKTSASGSTALTNALTSHTTTLGSNTLRTISLTGVTVQPGETFRIRIYGYDRANTDWSAQPLFIKHKGNYNTNAGPTFKGTVSLAGGVTASADTASTTENSAVNINVLSNDTATNTTVSTVTIQQQSANGTATVQPNKTITFTPNNGYSGTTNFQYKITGADNSTSTATVTVTVNAFAAPTANNDTATTGQNIPVTVNVLGNDVAGDGTINSIQITSGPANGTATVNGSNNIVYTPNASFTGTNTVTYKITDSNNKTATATLTVTVVAVQPAVAANDTAATAKNTPITLSVLANDNPGNSTITTVVVSGNPAHGTAIVNSDKTITYAPDNGYTGYDSFAYTITTAYNSVSTATVNMTVLQPTATGSLCGIYYIGAGPQNDFDTITEAVNHLNQYGVTCPVTFILSDVLYNNASGEVFPITINNFSGSSAVNTVTFKPQSGINVRVEAFRDAVTGSYTGVPAVFKLNGADNIVFDGSNTTNGTTRNLFIVNSSFAGPTDLTNDYTDRSVIWIASANSSNGSDNITVKYVQIKQTYKNSGDNYSLGIYSGDTGITGSNEIAVAQAQAQNNTLNVIGNDFMNVKQAVFVNGSSSIAQNINISKNDFGAENNTESVILPVKLHNVNNFTISENYIYKLYRNTPAADLAAGGINITGNSRNGSIVRNNLRDLVRNITNSQIFAGIVLSSTYANSNITVANNFILDVTASGNGGGYSNGYGIVVDQGSGYKIYNNSVVLTVNQPSTQVNFSAALYVNSNVTGLDVRNNIFVNTQTNTATVRSAIFVNNDVDNLNSVFSHLDYNNYFSTDKIGYIANQHDVNPTWPQNPDYVTLFSAWQSALNNTNNSANANNKDAHSLNVLPQFISGTDLHLANANTALDNAGTPIAGVTKDIDGQVRNTATPDIGADEFGATQMPVAGSGTGIYCDNSVTWDGETWVGGEPTALTDVIFAADYTFTNETLYACSIFVLEGANVLFEENANAVVTHAVSVEDDATLTFESSCNLVQIENVQNTGTVTIKRNSSRLKRLDYTVWSSPVTGTQSLLDFSPMTVPNRFYALNTQLNIYTSYPDPDSVLFEKGHGYLIRVPNNFSATVPQIFEGEFIGTPNNGDVRVPMEYVGQYSFNMIGNPYASPINVRKFINANLDNIEGTLWVWRKTNNPTKSTYATITKSGYVANNAPGGGGINGNNGNDLIGNPFDIIEDGVLNTGQGFFVNALAGVDVVFKNNMREVVNYNNFFRSQEADEAAEESLTSRYWLNVVTEDETVFSQILVGYSPYTTKVYDNGYDGRSFLDGTVSLYTIIPNGEEDVYKLSIQSRDAFSVTDTIKVGFISNIAGTFKLTIDHMDNLFANGQEIFVVDKLMDVTHNLSNSDYNFDSEAGTFEDRFEIIYSTQALGNDTHVIADKDIVVYQNNGEVTINAPETIAAVTIYDLTGKTVYTQNNIDSTDFAAAIAMKQQVAIVVITMENRQVITKKIMMN